MVQAMASVRTTEPVSSMYSAPVAGCTSPRIAGHVRGGRVITLRVGDGSTIDRGPGITTCS